MENYTEIDIDRLLQEELSKLKVAIEKIEESNEISKTTSKQFTDISDKFEQLSETIYKIEEAYNISNENNLAKPSIEDLKSLNETIELKIAQVNDDKKTILKKINDLKKSLDELLLFKEDFNHDINQKLNQFISEENLNSKIEVFESKLEKQKNEIDDLRLNEIKKLKSLFDTNIKEIGSVFNYLRELESSILLKTEKLYDTNFKKLNIQITELKTTLSANNLKLNESENAANYKINITNSKLSEFETLYAKQNKKIKHFRNYNIVLSILIFLMFIINVILNFSKYEDIFNWMGYFVSKIF